MGHAGDKDKQEYLKKNNIKYYPFMGRSESRSADLPPAG